MLSDKPGFLNYIPLRGILDPRWSWANGRTDSRLLWEPLPSSVMTLSLGQLQFCAMILSVPLRLGLPHASLGFWEQNLACSRTQLFLERMSLGKVGRAGEERGEIRSWGRSDGTAWKKFL